MERYKNVYGIYGGGIVFALGFGIFLLGAFRVKKLREEFKTALIVTAIIDLLLFYFSFDGESTYIRHIIVYLLIGGLYISWNSISFRSFGNEIRELDIDKPDGYLESIKKLKNPKEILYGVVFVFLYGLY